MTGIGVSQPFDQVRCLLCAACDGPVPMSPTDIVKALTCATCGSLYAWQDGILMLGASKDPDSYPAELHALLAAVEPRHFWFRERNRLIHSTLREAVGDLTERDVLDIGCGTGFVLASLEQAGCRVWGLDMNEAGLRHARHRVSGPLICEDAARVPFANQFSTVLLCDVIEHVADDHDVLRQARRALKPDGTLLVTVPAHQWLWTPLDDASGHYRRYSRSGLLATLERAGFSVQFARYFNTALLPIQFVQRRLLGKMGTEGPESRLSLIRRGLRVPPAPLNGLLGIAMSADLWLSRLPCTAGSSLIAVAHPA